MHKNWHQKLAMFSFSHGCGRSQSHLVQTEINTTLVQYNILGTLKSDSFRSKNVVVSTQTHLVQYNILGTMKSNSFNSKYCGRIYTKIKKTKCHALHHALLFDTKQINTRFLVTPKLKNWPGSNLLHETTLPKLLISLYFIVFSPLSLKHFTASSAVQQDNALPKNCLNSVQQDNAQPKN